MRSLLALALFPMGSRIALCAKEEDGACSSSDGTCADDSALRNLQGEFVQALQTEDLELAHRICQQKEMRGRLPLRVPEPRSGSPQLPLLAFLGRFVRSNLSMPGDQGVRRDATPHALGPLVECLVRRHGLDVNSRLPAHEVAYVFATRGDQDAAMDFVERGPWPQAAAKFHPTASSLLELALAGANTDLIRRLVAVGADTEAASYSGKHVLHRALAVPENAVVHFVQWFLLQTGGGKSVSADWFESFARLADPHDRELAAHIRRFGRAVSEGMPKSTETGLGYRHGEFAGFSRWATSRLTVACSTAAVGAFFEAIDDLRDVPSLHNAYKEALKAAKADRDNEALRRRAGSAKKAWQAAKAAAASGRGPGGGDGGGGRNGGVRHMAARADRMGRTPLHIAAMHDMGAVAAMVLSHAAEGSERTQLIGLVDALGRTAADLASLYGARSVLRVLRRFGAAPSAMRPAHRHTLRLQGGSSAATAEGDGGWLSSPTAFADAAGRCDIDEVSPADITSEVFARRYLFSGRPLILRGAAADWQFRKAWARERLLEQHGARLFQPTTIPYAQVYGANQQPTATRSLSEHVESMRSQDSSPSPSAPPVPYIFESAHGGSSSAGAGRSAQRSLIGDYPERPWFMAPSAPLIRAVAEAPSAAVTTNATEAMASAELISQLLHRVAVGQHEFYVGAAGSGAPMHFHGPAWNALAFGEKRWFLTPPQHATFSNIPAREWLEHVYPKAAVAQQAGGGRSEGAAAEDDEAVDALIRSPPLLLECTQRAGDVILVPDKWGHATVNVRESIGVALELQALDVDIDWSML